MSNPKRDLTFLLTLSCFLVFAPLSAQRGWGGGGLGLYGPGPRLGENVALALDLRNELNLTSDQTRALENLEGRIRAEVAPLGDRIDHTRSQILAGELSGAQGLLQLESLLTEYQLAADPYRVEVAQLLTAEQHQLLQAAMFETRPGLGQGLGRSTALGLGRGSARVGGYGVGLGRGRGLARGGGGYGRGYFRGGRRFIRR